MRNTPEQLDGMFPKPVIVETPETFQLVRILPPRRWRVRHLLAHHDGPVWSSAACVPPLAETALLDWFAVHLIVISFVFLPRLLMQKAP